MNSTRFLFCNGVVSQNPDVPPVSSFLEAHPGAYTTTRTHNNASCVLLWERHLKRLANSVRILFDTNPKFLFGPSWSTAHSPLLSPMWSPQFEPVIQCLVNESMSKVTPFVAKDTNAGQEWAITVLVSGNSEKLAGNVSIDEEKFSRVLDVHIHVGSYIPMVFGISGANLALVGRGRIIPSAKHSNWARSRKSLEKLRPPSVTELLLSNDGDHILEGSVSNFFVVSRRLSQHMGSIRVKKLERDRMGGEALPGRSWDDRGDNREGGHAESIRGGLLDDFMTTEVDRVLEWYYSSRNRKIHHIHPVI